MKKKYKPDYWAKAAKQEGLRSRASYKLIEIQKKYQLVKPGMIVVDLGAAPGGWSQLVVKWLENKGQVIAIDKSFIKPIPGVACIAAAVGSQNMRKELFQVLEKNEVDLVISDMAPNITGIRERDMAQSETLVYQALDLVRAVLASKGSFLIKVFQSTSIPDFRATLLESFSSVIVCKPKASKAHSKETYLLARGFKQ